MRFLAKNINRNIILTIIAALYYFPFINKGIILFDEGYMLHFAQRITQGQTPYYDFFVQYTPGFFYILALSFKIFGTGILAGRIVTVIIALASVLLTLFLLDELHMHSLKSKISATIVMMVLGFPLLNVPIDIWPCIMLTVALMIIFVKWSKSPASLTYAISLGLLLSLMLLMKQNLGLGFLLLINVLIFFWKEKSQKKEYALKIKSMLIINCLFVVLSIPWIYYFFIRSGDFSEFSRFSHDFVATHPFSYPPLSYLLQPLGLFKLLPYYLPVIFFLVLCWQYFFKKERSIYLFVSTFPLVGFVLTIIPLTDLIHIYPFLGLLLTMFLIFVQKTQVRFKIFYTILIGITVLVGLYLTLFKGQYRYGNPYKVDTTPVSLPRTEGILVDPTDAQEYLLVNNYVETHTKNTDNIFVYPFSPMLYFILNRQNPTRYANLLPGNVTIQEEKQIVQTLKKKKVSIVLVTGDYKFNTPISQWIMHNTVFVKNTTVCQIRKVITPNSKH